LQLTDRDSRDDRAPGRLERHEAFGFESPKRLSNRHAAHAETFGEVGLVEASTWAEASRGDRFAEVMRHLFRGELAPEAFEE